MTVLIYLAGVATPWLVLAAMWAVKLPYLRLMRQLEDALREAFKDLQLYP